jgi:hypothetical protein
MPCVACTYMPNASWRRRGGKAQGEGYLPCLERKPKAGTESTSAAKVCTSEARKTGETPCAAPGQRPQRGLVSLFACIKHAGIVRVALRQEQAAEEGGGRRAAAGDREERSSSLQKLLFLTVLEQESERIQQGRVR